MRSAGITYHGPRSNFWLEHAAIGRDEQLPAVPESATSADAAITDVSAITVDTSAKVFTDLPTPNDLMANIVTQDANYGGNKGKEKPQICHV